MSFTLLKGTEMAINIDLTDGITREQCDTLVDELCYRNYRWNRKRSPQIPVEWYKNVFSNVDAMERRYQWELASEKNKLN